jgi:hypothetical protein
MDNEREREVSENDVECIEHEETFTERENEMGEGSGRVTIEVRVVSGREVGVSDGNGSKH